MGTSSTSSGCPDPEADLSAYPDVWTGLLLEEAPGRVAGLEDGERFGAALAWLGDVDGDGVDDLAVGAPGAADGAGRVVLVRGPVLGAVDAADLPAWSGAVPGDGLGTWVAAPGDLDGDGLADLVAAAPGAAGGRGEAWLLLGLAEGEGPSLVVEGEVPGEALGRPARGSADLDGDGSSEVALAVPGAGEVRIVPAAATGRRARTEVGWGLRLDAVSGFGAVAALVPGPPALLWVGAAAEGCDAFQVDPLDGVVVAEIPGRTRLEDGACGWSAGLAVLEIDGAEGEDLLLSDRYDDALERPRVVGGTGSDRVPAVAGWLPPPQRVAAGGPGRAPGAWVADPAGFAAGPQAVFRPGAGIAWWVPGGVVAEELEAAVALLGEVAEAAAGTALDAEGDADGDGLGDLAVGAPGTCVGAARAGVVGIATAAWVDGG